MAEQQARRRPKKIVRKAISKKRKFVKDGVFYAELNDFLAKELAENGYAGCEVRVTPQRTEVIIRATQSSNVIGEHGRRIRELTALVQKRFKFPKTGLILFAEKVKNKSFSALAQAESVKYKLLTGLSVRRAAYSVLKFIMDKEKKEGAQGCEVVVTGKLRGQRAKAMKFRDGFMIHAGDATNYYIDTAVKHVHLPQGVIGIKVKIMLPYDPTGRTGGVTKPLPDQITIFEPKPNEYEQDTQGDIPSEFAIGGQQQPPQEPQAPIEPMPQPIQQQQPIIDNTQQQFVATQPQQQTGDVFGAPQQPENVPVDQYGAPPQDTQPLDTQPAQQFDQTAQQYGTQAQDFGGGAQQYGGPPPQQQYDQYAQQQPQQQQQQPPPQQYQQFDNQYQQPMQSQYGQPPPQQQQQQPAGGQQQYGQQQQQQQQGGQQGGQQYNNQGGQYYDPNRQNYNY